MKSNGRIWIELSFLCLNIFRPTTFYFYRAHAFRSNYRYVIFVLEMGFDSFNLRKYYFILFHEFLKWQYLRSPRTGLCVVCAIAEVNACIESSFQFKLHGKWKRQMVNSSLSNLSINAINFKHNLFIFWIICRKAVTHTLSTFHFPLSTTLNFPINFPEHKY